MLRRGLSCLGTAMLIGVGLILATIVQQMYVSNVQEPKCFDYVREHNLADADVLVFKGVTIASNKFQGHICHFEDTRTGAPVSIEFAENDIPTTTDTLQVMSMVCAFLSVVLVWGVLGFGYAIWQIFQKRKRRPIYERYVRKHDNHA